MTTEAALVIVAVEPVVVEVVVVVLEAPKTAPELVDPVPVAVATAISTVPVHVAPVGQQAMFFAWSVVHIEPAVQHAPASAAAKVEQEL